MSPSSDSERQAGAGPAPEPADRSNALTFDALVRGERGAVEPVAALAALIAVGAALGLYTVALDEAAPDGDRNVAGTTLDRVEREATVGGVVDPDRLTAPDLNHYAATIVELETRHETWRTNGEAATPPGHSAPAREGDDGIEPKEVDVPPARSPDVAGRTVTVRVAPGGNVRGTLRVVVHQ